MPQCHTATMPRLHNGRHWKPKHGSRLRFCKQLPDVTLPPLLRISASGTTWISGCDSYTASKKILAISSLGRIWDIFANSQASSNNGARHNIDCFRIPWLTSRWHHLEVISPQPSPKKILDQTQHSCSQNKTSLSNIQVIPVDARTHQK